MALVFGDSFDHYAVADITKKWTAASNLATTFLDATAALPPHGNGLRLSNSVTIEKTLPVALATFVCGFWYKCEEAAGTARIIAAFMDSSTTTNIHVSVRRDTLNRMTLCRDATVLATSTNTFTQGVWYHIEIKATIGDAPDGAYEVRVDGSATNWIAAATGADTRNSGNATTGSVRLYGGINSATASHAFSDFYILNTTGAPNDFIGPSRFQVARVAGVGTTAEFTGNYADNWQNVADLFGDGDGTFNQSSTAGQTDQFAMTDVPTGTIHAVQIVMMAKRDAGTARTIRPVTRISGSDYNGTTVTVGSSYAYLMEALSVSPATSSAWTDSEINAAEFGYELVS